VGVAQLGSATALGAVGRRFESCLPHQLLSGEIMSTVEHVVMVPIEVELDEDVLAVIEDIAEKTGFTIDKIVEYSLANTIIEKAMRS
jgi:CRISPR/Cas system-associated protein Cas7 (RAMP superfamily)